MSKKRRIIAIILSVIILSLTGYFNYRVHFRNECVYDRMMKNPLVLDKTRKMSKAELIYNLSLIAEREGLKISSPELDLEIQYYDEASEMWEIEMSKEEAAKAIKKLYYCLEGRYGSLEEEPIEIRFLMQAMLYIRGRNLSNDLDNLIGITGIYRFDEIEYYNKKYRTDIPFDEFELLYDEYNADILPHESQVDLLTHAWIYETGYDRPGLDQKYRFISPDINEYKK